jgi:large subunit ribosomal protein L25
MAYETPTIEAQPRERTGSRYAQRLRQTGRLPAVIYGHKIDPLAVSVDEKEILLALHHGTHVMELAVAGGSTETCLVKDLQFGYLGDNVVHIDFARVNLEEEVTVNVHLTFVGNPHEAQRAGAILKHDQTELAVKCMVQAIPEDIKVDLNPMEGTTLHASEIELPAGLELAEDPSSIVVSISFVRAEEPEGEAVDVEGAAEPEVITEAKAEEETTEA